MEVWYCPKCNAIASPGYLPTPHPDGNIYCPHCNDTKMERKTLMELLQPQTAAIADKAAPVPDLVALTIAAALEQPEVRMMVGNFVSNVFKKFGMR